MAKLSRTNKYQDLRNELDEETTAAQTAPSEPIKLTRASRNQNIATHAMENKTAAVQVQTTVKPGVIDELLGEVKQYNIDNGDRAAQDTQINILRSLDEDRSASIKRKKHLETMEANRDFGGTTMNINAIDIETVSRPVNKPVITEETAIAEVLETEAEEETNNLTEIDASLILGNSNLFADDKIEGDNLEMFDLGVDDFDQTIRQETKPSAKPKSRKAGKKETEAVQEEEPSSAKQKKKKKKDKPVPAEETDLTPSNTLALQDSEQDDESEHSGSKFGNIVMVLLILVLLATIGYTIYLISKIGIL